MRNINMYGLQRALDTSVVICRLLPRHLQPRAIHEIVELSR
jgi:hypothetical protein